MPFTDTVQALLVGLETDDPADWKRKAARIAWVKETMGAWAVAQEEMDDRCTEAVDLLDEEDFLRLFDAEQAKVCAIIAKIRAVIDRDEWPRELYFGGV